MVSGGGRTVSGRTRGWHGKRDLLDMMQHAFASEGEQVLRQMETAVSSLRDSVPLPDADTKRPVKRAAVAEGSSAGGNSWERVQAAGGVGRRPLAELPWEGDSDIPAKWERERACARNKGGGGLMHLLGTSVSSTRNKAASPARTKVPPAPVNSSGARIASLSSVSRSELIQQVLYGSVCPPLHQLWQAHWRGVMPIHQMLLKSSGSLHSSFAERLRSVTMFVDPKGEKRSGVERRVGAGESQGAQAEETSALQPILRLLLALAFPAVAGGSGGDADETARLSRKALAIFDLACCPPVVSVTATAGTQELEATLGLLMAAHNALFEGKGAQCLRERREWQMMRELGRDRLKHLRFAKRDGDCRNSSQSERDIPLKCAAFWDVVAGVDRCWEEAAAVLVTVCGEQECLHFVRTRAARGCGRERALSALLLKRLMAMAVARRSKAGQLLSNVAILTH